jgi:catalase
MSDATQTRDPQYKNQVPYRERGNYHAERYKELKAEGICPRCLKGHADKMLNGRYFVYCKECRQKNLTANYNSLYRAR